MRIRRIFLIMICSWTILFPLVLSDCKQSYMAFLEMLFYCLSLYFMNKLLQDAISCLRCCSILIHITRTVTSILLISDLCYPGPGLWESWPHTYPSLVQNEELQEKHLHLFPVSGGDQSQINLLVNKFDFKSKSNTSNPICCPLKALHLLLPS